eukprot:CAMPEP_0119378536 /NCGR_PEP_ID=MMETSP1334-20130426/48709_1 /TAXON_ID=127549 /ORGANISM="Calcidiscus leptoporus, Strain RCC1130" /LENGTH=54 /DNA_ID=CAMNT_0007397765 /DNA_START=436 /DNA_END=598 /DNA_ORIENTATION=+
MPASAQLDLWNANAPGGFTCPGHVHAGVAKTNSGRDPAPEFICAASYPPSRAHV